ncbi:kynurenine 3-monooxygenase, mitochondrial precursor [Gonapodya sp. JEL0774]|nr:kynurenine 3-monooxygenase, mitochondrial precursor [Gonapodya sp. JEL0774]
MSGNMPSPSDSSDYLVIGAGPVGLLAALGLAKRGFAVTVFEGRDSLDQRREESYPIGVNLRGIRALGSIGGPALASQLQNSGTIIDSFDIYGGKRRVAQAVGGTIWSQTRFAVTKAIYDACIEFENAKSVDTKGSISILFGKLFVRFEILEDGKLSGRLYFGDGTTVNVPVGTRVVGADGGGSCVRKALVQVTQGKDNEIEETLVPWNLSFRVLFADKAPLSHLDAKIHYIMSGVYVAVSGGPSDPWTFALSCRPNSPHYDLFHTTTDTPTTEQISALRAHILKACPIAADSEQGLNAVISEEEMRAFFSRRIFSGNLVHVSKCQFNGWVVLLGDAAHALFPPTGEGVNSGLDDVHSLMKSLDMSLSDSSVSPFHHYAVIRQPSIDALFSLARDIWTSQSGSAGDKVVAMGSNILFSMFSKSKDRPTESELRYGPPAKEALLEYPEVWKRHLENVGGYRKVLKWMVWPWANVSSDLF